jgi:protein phosphatase
LLHQKLADGDESIQYPELYEDCVDIGQRYRLLKRDDLEKEQGDWQVIGDQRADGQYFLGRVVDCQPLQPSILKILLSQHNEFLARLPELQRSDDDPTWQTLALPELAFPYFKLRDLNPTIPDVYDAWCEENNEYVLLADRQSWPHLIELLEQETIPPLQLIFWLNQMVTLWQSLADLHCLQSLLIPTNIYIDEDQNLAIQQLFPDVDPIPSLSQLGQQWQDWLTKTQEHPLESLIAVLEEVGQGKIAAIAEFKTRLEVLGQELNAPATLADEVFPVFETEMLEDDGPPSTPQSTLPDANLADGAEIDDASTAVLQMQLISLSDSGYTDRGKQRPHNEDYFGLTTFVETQRNNQGKSVQAKGIYVVCDGMGGHSAGEVASHMAVNTLQAFFNEHWQAQFPSANVIAEGILLANEVIYDTNQKNASSGSGRMGTTLVMALVQNTKVAIAHVGDSRIYRVTRKGGLEQLTVDHEVGQQAIQNGLDPKIAYSRPDAYQLTQALGPHDSQYVQPDIRFLEIEEDTLLLLCSDGISDNDLLEANWESKLLPLLSSSQDIDRGLRKLMEFSNEYNGHDNLTGVLIRLKVRPQIPIDVW